MRSIVILTATVLCVFTVVGAHAAGLRGDDLDWAALGPFRPLASQSTADLYGQTLSADPLDPNRVAYCVDGAVQLTLDGGAFWTSWPTAAVRSTIVDAGFALLPQDDASPHCRAILLDSAHPDSLFAVFDGARGPAPPLYKLGLVTFDAGQSWQAVPPPAAAGPDRFGGFQPQANSVLALFHGASGTPSTALNFSLVQTADGGVTWTPGQLACPPLGPCLRWGPAPSTITGMGAPRLQALWVSPDAGATWGAPYPPLSSELRGPTGAAVAALSPDEALLIRGFDPDPLRLTRDAGHTWVPIGLPHLPGQTSGAAVYVFLQLLPDGSLLALDDAAGWQLLPPATPNWCSVTGTPSDRFYTAVQVIGDRLWWRPSSTATDPEPTPLNVPLANVHCAPGL